MENQGYEVAGWKFSLDPTPGAAEWTWLREYRDHTFKVVADPYGAANVLRIFLSGPGIAAKELAAVDLPLDPELFTWPSYVGIMREYLVQAWDDIADIETVRSLKSDLADHQTVEGLKIDLAEHNRQLADDYTLNELRDVRGYLMDRGETREGAERILIEAVNYIKEDDLEQ